MGNISSMSKGGLHKHLDNLKHQGHGNNAEQLLSSASGLALSFGEMLEENRRLKNERKKERSREYYAKNKDVIKAQRLKIVNDKKATTNRIQDQSDAYDQINQQLNEEGCTCTADSGPCNYCETCRCCECDEPIDEVDIEKWESAGEMCLECAG